MSLPYLCNWEKLERSRDLWHFYNACIVTVGSLRNFHDSRCLAQRIRLTGRKASSIYHRMSHDDRLVCISTYRSFYSRDFRGRSFTSNLRISGANSIKLNDPAAAAHTETVNKRRPWKINLKRPTSMTRVKISRVLDDRWTLIARARARVDKSTKVSAFSLQNAHFFSFLSFLAAPATGILCLGEFFQNVSKCSDSVR